MSKNFASIQDFVDGYTALPPAAERARRLAESVLRGEIDTKSESTNMETNSDRRDVYAQEEQVVVNNTAEAAPHTNRLIPRLTEIPIPAQPTTLGDIVLTLDSLLDASKVSLVIVRTPMAIIKMPARLVFTGEYSLGFFVPVNSSAEFSVGASFELEIDNKRTPVLYAGGTCAIPKSRYQLLTFLLDKNISEQEI